MQLPNIFQNSPKNSLWGAAHGSICIQEAQPASPSLKPRLLRELANAAGVMNLTILSISCFYVSSLISSANVRVSSARPPPPASPPDIFGEERRGAESRQDRSVFMG
jgi:hypothetical protein